MHAKPQESPFSSDWIPIFASQFVALSAGLAGIHLSSRVVSPETYGHYNLFLTIVPIAPLITHAGLIRHAARYWAQEPDQRAYIIWLLRRSAGPSALVLGVAIVGAVVALLRGQSMWAAGCILAALASLSGTLAQAAQNSFQAARMYWVDFAVTATNSTTRTFLPIIAAAWFAGSFPAMAIAFLIHAAITAMFGSTLLLRKSNGGGSTAITHRSGEYMGNFAITGLLNVLNAGMVRWVVGACHDAEAVGYVSLAGNISFAVTGIMSGACAQFYFPRQLARPDQRNSITRQALLVFGLAAFAVGIVLHTALPWLVGTLLERTYEPALKFVLPMFALGTTIGALTLAQNHYLAENRVDRATSLSAAFSVALALGASLAALHSLTAVGRFLLATPLLLGLLALAFLYAGAWLRERRIFSSLRRWCGFP